MNGLFGAVLPVFLLIFLGYGLKRSKFLPQEFWEGAERLTYFILLPALLVVLLSGADYSALAAPRMVGAIVLAILIITGAAFALRARTGLPSAAFTSLYQGLVRQSGYMGLALSFALFGEPGLEAAALAIATLVPLGNVLCVILLLRDGGEKAPDVLLRSLLRNPMILACLLGILLNLLGLGLPVFLNNTLEILAQGALPLGLLTVGAGLVLGQVRSDAKALWIAIAGKLILLPLITFATCALLGVTGLALFTAVMFNGLPTAPSSYILARQMGGPTRLDEDYFHTRLMANVLGGGFASRINMNLREDKGYSYGARGGVAYRRDHGYFYAVSSVRSDSTHQSLQEVFKEIDGLKSKAVPATDAELTREKNGDILGLPGDFATGQQALGRYRGLVYYGLPLDYYNSFVEKVSQVTLDDVMAAADKHLQPQNALVLIVGDAEAAQIAHADGNNAPMTDEAGKPVTLLPALEAFAKARKGGKGSLVIVDTDGVVLETR